MLWDVQDLHLSHIGQSRQDKKIFSIGETLLTNGFEEGLCNDI